MSRKTLVALALLAAALGGFFYYDTYWLGPAREKAESAKGRLWDVESKDVEALTIKRKSETLRLKRVEGGWEMLLPVKARGDRGAVDGVVTTLVTLRVDREIDPNPAKPAEFGLEPPEAEISLEVKGRKEPLVLRVGSKSPTGAWVYAREGVKPAVVAVSETVARDATRAVADLRDRTVLAFDRKSVTALDIQLDGERMSVERREGGKWEIVKPRTYQADADLLSDFLDKLDGARVKEFVDETPTSLAPYGLDRPAAVTLWLGRDKDRSQKILRLGRLDKDKKGLYVSRGGETSVMLAGEELWAAVPKTVAALRDKVVIAYAWDRATRVELEHARGPVTLEREGSSWKLTAPEPLKADPGTVNGLLWRLRDLRATGFLAEEARDIARLLPKPEVTVRIWEEGAKEPRVLLVGASREKRGGEPAAVAAVAGRGPVMLVGGKALQDLALTAHDLRDKTLLGGFELSDVKRARLIAAGKPLSVERKGESEWKLVEPSRGPAKEARVNDLLLTLKTLRWKDIVSPKGDDAARFGLERPELEVTLYRGDGGELGTLLVGREDGPVAYVRLKGAPAIYSVDSKLIGDLRRAPAEIGG